MFPRFSPEEFARRHVAARAMMRQEGLDVLVVYGTSALSRHHQADVHYLTGFLGNRTAYVVVPAQGEPALFVQSFNHVPNAREMAVVSVRWGGVSSASSVASYVHETCGTAGTLGYVGEVPHADVLRWYQEIPQWRLRDVTEAYRALRLVKSPEELAWMRRGAALTDAAVLALVERVRPGLREDQLGAIVETAALQEGGLPHLAYISSTPQDAPTVCVPRPCLSRRVVRSGDVINTEISVSYGGYSGQLHRPIFVEREPGPLYQRLWEVALEAYTRCSAILRDGATIDDVLDAAEVIHARGLTIVDDLLHGFGVGLLPPTVRTRETAHTPHPPFTFRSGMCVVLQPNVVTPDQQAGVQVGNLFHITETGAECLHRVPVQYFVVPRS